MDQRITCEMCENAQGEIEHVMEHPSGVRLIAGSVCSGHMALPAHYQDMSHDVLVEALAEASKFDAERRGIGGKLAT